MLTIDEMQTAAVIFMTMIRGMKMTGAAGKIMRIILTGCTGCFLMMKITGKMIAGTATIMTAMMAVIMMSHRSASVKISCVVF